MTQIEKLMSGLFPLFVTFKRLLITILPYSKLLELLFLRKWLLLDHVHQLGTLVV